MGGYGDFAAVYDELTGNVDYAQRTDYLCSLFERFDKMPTLLLDLACGTGEFSCRMAQKGVSVIGVDLSPEMLTAAREKAADCGVDILFLCQDAAELDLYGTVDGAICCLDSLNHITDYNDFCAAISRVSLFLEKDRLFIFDLNTPYKHREILGNNTLVLDTEKVYCVWQNKYTENNTVEISLDFFTEQDGAYYRSGESFCERAYSDTEVKAALDKAGLRIEAIYAENTTLPPDAATQRIIYVTRKI